MTISVFPLGVIPLAETLHKRAIVGYMSISCYEIILKKYMANVLSGADGIWMFQITIATLCFTFNN